MIYRNIETVLFTIILFISVHSFGQNIDSLATKKQMDCSDIAHSSSLYFVRYMNEGKIDSAKNMLNYWENECGMSEPVFRAKVLLALKTRQFNDALLSEKPIDNILNYQNRMRMIEFSIYHRYEQYKSFYGFVPLGEDFDKYTRQLAFFVKAHYNPESIEYLLTELYSDNYDTIFSKIQSKNYKESFLGNEYNKALKKAKRIPEYHVSTITGIWIPTGDLVKMGYHPELGFQAGCKQKRMNYDLTVALKFLIYAKSNNNPLAVPDYFSGKYIGFDVGWDFYAKKGHEIQALGGIAYDDINVLEKNKEIRITFIPAATYNFNLGVAYRYYITNDVYIGLRAKYHIVDYTLNKVIDFTGNPITVHFTFGTVFNSARSEKLHDLKYTFRK